MDGTNYQSSASSLFATAARRQYVTFTCHYDHPNQKWNVFEVVDGHEIFICAFATLKEAQDFCDGKVINAG